MTRSSSSALPTAETGGRAVSGWPRHLLDVADLDFGDLGQLMRSADEFGAAQLMAGGAGEPLRRRQVALLFEEASTRTRVSFEVAARNLGGEVLVLDPVRSSLVKAETLTDTARTLGALGISVLVLRHHRSGAPWVAAGHFPGSVINAGDGWHAHPTQALLDLYTLRRAFGTADLHGRKIVIVGDLRHSRVARSNAWSLTAAGAELWACGPAGLLRGFEELAEQLPSERSLTLTDDLETALAGAEAVMALRIQFERMEKGTISKSEYVARYQLTEDRLLRARPGAHFLHPGPVNEGIEVTREVARGPRSLVLEQVRNGVPMRMAVLAALARAPGSGDA